MHRRVAAALWTTLAAGSAGWADLPSVARLSEAQPPTREQWFAYYHLRQARQEWVAAGADCRTRPCAGPLELWEEVTYFPCEGCLSARPKRCSADSPAAGCGAYGVRHPMPYYIPNPVLAVERPAAWRCRRQSLRDPNNRVEVTLGVWE